MQKFDLINDMGEFHFLYNSNSEDNQNFNDTKYLTFDNNQFNLENLYDDWDDEEEGFYSTITVEITNKRPSVFEYLRKLGKITICTNSDPEIHIIGLDDAEEETFIIPEKDYTTLTFYANWKKTKLFIKVS